jgi:hypothetical protein
VSGMDRQADMTVYKAACGKCLHKAAHEVDLHSIPAQSTSAVLSACTPLAEGDMVPCQKAKCVICWVAAAVVAVQDCECFAGCWLPRSAAGVAW